MTRNPQRIFFFILHLSTEAELQRGGRSGYSILCIHALYRLATCAVHVVNQDEMVTEEMQNPS